MIISILGGGATGCAVIIAILKELKKHKQKTHIQFRVFDPSPLGDGLAYKDIDHRLLLNTSAGITSLVYDDLSHFIRWLDTHKNLWASRYPEIKQYNESSFLPRSLTGLYIENTLNQELASFKDSQIEIIHTAEWVEDIRYNQDNQSIKIVTDQGHYLSDYCVLCTGYGNGVTHTYSHLLGAPTYYPSPYLYPQQIKAIPKNKRILILGTRLTAIDTAILLQDHKHVVMASRQGNLPSVRNRFIPTTPKYLTEKQQKKIIAHKLSTKSITEAIELELSLVYGKKIDLKQIDLISNQIEALKLDLKAAKNGTNLWEDSIFTIVRFITKAWPHLSFSDRKHFLQQNEHFISRYITSFPYENAQIINQMLNSKKLSVRRGIKRVDYENHQFKAIFFENNQRYEEIFDYVINATPISGRVQDSSFTVYKNLSKHGIVTENHFGGIKIGKHLQLKSTYYCNDRFYAAGPMVYGEFPFTNFLYSSAEQAKIIAQDLCKKTGLYHEHHFFSRKKTA